MLKPLEDFMTQAMVWLYGMTGSYAAAIVLLTVAIRVLIAPLYMVQMKSMKKMQEIQPEMRKLQEKYKKDPERLNREMMELYRKNRVNPLSGCLPLLIQLPFLWAIFRVLYSFPYEGTPTLFGVIRLDQKDPTYVLPALSGIATFAQSWLSGAAADPSQRAMLYVMPVLITWFATQYPAGLALYWLLTTLLSIGQQWLYPGFQPRGPKREAAAR